VRYLIMFTAGRSGRPGPAPPLPRRRARGELAVARPASSRPAPG